MARKGLVRSLALLLVASFLAGCGELKDLPTEPIDDLPPDPTATFTRVQSEVLTPTCAVAGCHDAFTAQEGLVLVAESSYALLVNTRSSQSPLDRVEPGQPDSSYLFLKVSGGAGIVGDRMPQNRPPLSDASTRLIRDWIRRGAPND